MAKQVQLRWVAHTELSAAHAAYVVATGAPCIDPKTERKLVEPVTAINNRLLSASIDMSVFWQQYWSQLLADETPGDACEYALMVGGCSEMQVEQTAKAMTRQLNDARLAFLERFPKLEEQLKLRARPLRDRWETVGPGLLKDVERQIWENSPPDQWWPSRLTALMVQPMVGGDGGIDIANSRLWAEAMLTDADVAIPEALRIAWLITRIAIESQKVAPPKDGGPIDHALETPWSFASVPLVLTAGARLDLIRGDSLPIQRAMELWQFGDPQTAETLARWWHDLQQAPTPLPVALRQLSERLNDQSPAEIRSTEEAE